MPRNKEYVPKVNDHVFLKGAMGRFIVATVDAKRKTAAVRTAAGPVIFYYEVVWSKLSAPDSFASVDCHEIVMVDISDLGQARAAKIQSMDRAAPRNSQVLLRYDLDDANKLFIYSTIQRI